MSPGSAGFPGAVRRFRTSGLKVPQIGWNSLQFTRPDARLWQGLESGDHVYFVHSYYPDTTDRSIIAATADYGESVRGGHRTGTDDGSAVPPREKPGDGAEDAGELRGVRSFIR